MPYQAPMRCGTRHDCAGGDGYFLSHAAGSWCPAYAADKTKLFVCHKLLGLSHQLGRLNIQGMGKLEDCADGWLVLSRFNQRNEVALPECVNDFATPCFMNLRCRVVLFQSVSFGLAVG